MAVYLKISELPAASAAAATDQVEVNQSGTSRRVTVAQLGVAAGGSIVREATLVAPATEMTFYSLGIKSALVFFQVYATVNATAVNFQLATGSSPLTASNYGLQQLYGSTTTAAASVAGPSTNINLSNCDTALPMYGSITIPDLSQGRATADFGTHSGGTSYRFAQGWTMPTAGDGFRLFVTSNSFATGSFVRVIGWP